MTTLAPPPTPARLAPPPAITYPESDGQPMADNTRQFQWIVSIHNGLAALFKDDPNVFVAGDLLWYPTEGDNKTRAAPDVLVAFGRPPGHRGSYLQWFEANIPPQVVFEILSPGNRPMEMTRKFSFYQRFGVEEYYLFDPDSGELSGWLRREGALEVIESMQGWVSPRLGVKFELHGVDLVLYRPDGTRFETYNELIDRAEAERTRAEAEHQRAETEAQNAATERARADKLAEKLRALGLDPDTP